MTVTPEDCWTLPASGDCPWIAKDHSFAGWVPNVSGHLSFNLVDPHSGLPTYNYQSDLAEPRIVALHRERLAQDYPFPDWLMRRIRPSARQDFILLAQSCAAHTPVLLSDEPTNIADANGVLVGIVAILPSEKRARRRKIRNQLLLDVDEAVTEAISQYASGTARDATLTDQLLKGLQDAREHVACYFLRFALFRTGELRIWFELGEFLGRDIVADPPSDAERLAADHIAPQAYYFIKDMLHAHYHHDKSSDQLLPLVRLKGTEDSIDEDDTAWRYATLRGLVRVVVELRQSRSLDAHKRAIGIIAYAKSFQCVLARILRGRTVDETPRLSPAVMPYDFSNLISSIEAIDASVQAGVTARLQLFAIVVGIFLSGLALWSGAVQVQPALCEALESTKACQPISAGPSVTILHWVIANPLAFLAFLVVLGFAAFVIFFRGTGALPFVERFIHWSERLAEAVAAEVSQRTKRSDWLGLAIGLLAMFAPIAGVTALALWVLPTRTVSSVEALPPDRRGVWDQLSKHADLRFSESALLLEGPFAAELRGILGDDFADFARLLGDDAILRSDGPLLYAVPEKVKPGADTAYLIIDRSSDRYEIGFRIDSRNQVYRTAGAVLKRPQTVQRLLGDSPADVVAVGVEKSICHVEQAGEGNRVIQLSGELLAGKDCQYSLDLNAGQSLSFDRARSRGLAVEVIEGERATAINPVFRPAKAGAIEVRVRWDGWNPKPAEALRPRKFYVRLEMH